MFIRNPYNYSMRAASLESGLACEGESLTVQSMKEEANINTIVRRFGVTGQLPQGVRIPTYGDFTGISDFAEALEALSQAEESFMQMSAVTRARFDNDPAKFVEFCSNKDNLEEMRKMGLAVPAPEAPVPPASS